jgi:hypothetical protein
VYDPDKQLTEEVASRALFRPRVAADHLYLRCLCVGEWATVEAFGNELPVNAPDLLLVATSLHSDEEFFGELARYSGSHPATRCVLVEDEADDGVRAAALASGIQPYLVLADDGLRKVQEIVRGVLRECWLACVAAA